MTNAKVKVTEEVAEAIRKKHRYWADRPLEEHTQLFGEAVGFECGIFRIFRGLA